MQSIRQLAGVLAVLAATAVAAAEPAARWDPVPLGSVRWRGHLGERLDLISRARITSPVAWERLYPETEDAFRLREDDRDHPRAGQWRGEF